MYLKKYSTPIIVFLAAFLSANAQVSPTRSTQEVGVNSANKTSGVSVSPAHFHLALKQSESKMYTITVNNDTPNSQSFDLKMYDFNMNGKGKSSFLPAGKGDYSLSQWTSISPTFIELKPYEKRKVNFTVTIPNTDKGRKAAWSIIMVEQQEARTSLSPNDRNDNTVALGVIPTFAFGIFVYQNPPNVLLNQVEFVDFLYTDIEGREKSITIEAENKGDGISYSTAYIDLTNTSTGEQKRLKVKKFTILPGLIRDFKFKIPDDTPKGNYIAVGVLDFENSEEIQAAKMEFTIE